MEELLNNSEIMANIMGGLEPLVSNETTRLLLAQTLLSAFYTAATSDAYEEDLDILSDTELGFDSGWATLIHDKLAVKTIEETQLALGLVPDQVIVDFGSWFVPRFAQALELGFCIEETLAQ